MTLRTPAAVAASIALAAGAAACGGSSNSSSGSSSGSSSSSSSSTSRKPPAKISSLSGKSTAVALDSGFVKALTTLKLTPGPVGSASISKAGLAPSRSPAATSPTTSRAAPPYVEGNDPAHRLGHQPDRRRQDRELTNFVVDPGKSVLTGKVSVNGKAAVTAPRCSSSTAARCSRSRQERRDGVLYGTTVSLKPGAADLLNKTFGVKALKGGLKIGVAKITVNTGA